MPAPSKGLSAQELQSAWAMARIFAAYVQPGTPGYMPVLVAPDGRTAVVAAQVRKLCARLKVDGFA